MNKHRRRLPGHRDRQHGFTLIEITVAIVILTLLSAFAAYGLAHDVDDSAAQSTGRYLMQMRGAVVDLQVKHEAWLSGVDVASAPAGTYPTPPTLSWVGVDGAQVARGGISDLDSLGLLPTGLQQFPPLGDVARFILVRQGTCPGEDCQTGAFVYTCHPISSQRTRRQVGGCTAPAGSRAQYSPSILSKVIQATEGYGGHDAMAGENVRGALMDVPRTWFDFGSETGHAVLAAGLGATPFTQFVRHGETRPVTLHNTLTVDQTIQSNKGLLLNTTVVPGAACTPEGLYASTAGKMLAVCVNGAWFQATGHVVTGVFTNLPNGAAIAAVTCPAGLTAWRYVSLQTLGVTVTGSDVNVAGSVGGTISGSGAVNAAGSVSVSGSFAGTFQNSGSSYVRVTQGASASADRIVIAPADANARAAVIQGCNG